MKAGLKSLAAAALALAALTLAGCNKVSAVAEGDMAMGAAEGAKVTVVEYASPTCPHCALWQQNTWPAFKAKYVDTNKVRYVFRELPTPPAEFAYAGFLLARCAGEDRYFKVMHALMENQKEWQGGPMEPRASLLKTAKDFGFNEDQFMACVSNPEAISALEQRIQTAMAAGITGTPTFVVNGKTVAYTGGEGPPMPLLEAAIEPELAK